MQTPKKIAVVGSGLVGTLLAIYLKRQGHTVHVYDRSKDIRKVTFSGRSINLVMSNRGWKALADVGLDHEIKKIGIPVDKRAIHIDKDTVNTQYYGKEGETIYSLSRGILNRKMIDLAENEGVEFFFEQKIWDVTLATAILCLEPMALFLESDIKCNVKACSIIRKNFCKLDIRNYMFLQTQMDRINWTQIHYTFGLEATSC
jgi:hypothetical protein